MEAYNNLVNRLLTYAYGITINTLSQLTVKGYDMSEASCVADQCALIAISRYEYGMPIRAFFKTIFVRELTKSIEKYVEEVSGRTWVELDEECYDERYSKSECIGTREEDARANYEINELKIILNEKRENESKESQRQRKALLMKMEGYSVEEIAKSMRLSSSQVRRLLEKDDEGTPLQEIKIKLK